MLQGRRARARRVQQVRQLLEGHLEWSRYRLSRELCRLWHWQAPNGQIQTWPPARCCSNWSSVAAWCCRPSAALPPTGCCTKSFARSLMRRSDPRRVRPVEAAGSDRTQSAAPRSFALRVAPSPASFSYSSPVGLNLKYLVRDCHGRPLSCLLFGFGGLEVRRAGPVYRLEFAGAADASASGDQQYAVCTFTWVRVPGLASHVLGRVLRRLRQDWRRKYARPLEMVETFVDTSRFSGGVIAPPTGSTWGRPLAVPGKTATANCRRPPRGCGSIRWTRGSAAASAPNEPPATTLPAGPLRLGQADRVGTGFGSQAAASAP